MKSREVVENMVSITELSQKSSQIVSKVEKGQTQYIAKRNKVVAALSLIHISEPTRPY